MEAVEEVEEVGGEVEEVRHRDRLHGDRLLRHRPLLMKKADVLFGGMNLVLRICDAF